MLPGGSRCGGVASNALLHQLTPPREGMSESLTGGLVPLGKRAGSGSTGSSNLSGGLIPLESGGLAAAAASFRRLASDGVPSREVEGRSLDSEDGIEEDMGLGVTASSLRGDKKVRFRKQQQLLWQNRTGIFVSPHVGI